VSVITAATAVLLIGGCNSSDPGISRAENVITYSDFGAAGDGVTDDFNAIIATHNEANLTGKKVQATPGAKYYIGGEPKTARIQTDTDWTGAEFIIDDTAVRRIGTAWSDSWIFEISSVRKSFEIVSVKTLQKNQEKLNLSLPYASLLSAVDSTTKQYIRRGVNTNEGSDQTDVFIVDKNGNVDMSAPILWDYNNITRLTAYPIDEDVLTVRGGKFTTIANTEPRAYAGQYLKRGILISRSNTVIDGLVHLVTGEGEVGMGYNGFIRTGKCANVTVKNTILTGRSSYGVTIEDQVVTTGTSSYDISIESTVNMSVINCVQSNDINDDRYWGIFTTNLSKNMVLDGVKFSRYDAHRGIHNVTILNSQLGWMGIRLVGSGLLHVENTKVFTQNFIEFRYDYGSTWEGDVVIRNCTFAPGDKLNGAVIIYTNNNGGWDFGYDCYMPKTITINGFTVEDTPPPAGYEGVYLLSAATSSPSALPLTENIYLSGFVSSKPYRMKPRDINIPVIMDSEQ
jgi:hypothetical protein